MDYAATDHLFKYMMLNTLRNQRAAPQES